MRKLLISLLLASAAASPAIAAPDDDREARLQARAERQQARSEARAERSSEARSVEREADVQSVVERPARVRDNAATRETRRDSLQAGQLQRIEQREQRIDQIQSNRELRQSQRPLPRVLRNRVPVVSETPQEGTQPPLRADSQRSSSQRWSTGWRHNSKYDWYNHRKRNRWLFNLGFYYDPFGWGYRPYSIGWRMWPSYYSSRYWLNDPWQYRLPYAPPGYRWIRYWDDAVLVDTWTGEVVDVIYNFFW